MLPFEIHFQTGLPASEQIVYAATRAVVSGAMRPGDRFPSVRQLSQELKVNPNTAHKAVAALIAAGLLETQPGIGTVVSAAPEPSRQEIARLLGPEVERLVVEALRFSLTFEEVSAALAETWKRLSQSPQ